MLTPATSRLGFKYSTRPSPVGHPLHEIAHRLVLKAAPPPKPTDWRPILRPVRNQSIKGYCFGFATAAVKEANCVFWSMARGGPATPLGAYLSPDYVGWKTQTAEGTFGQDAGGNLADAFEVTRAWGVCPEEFLPYDPNNAAHAGDARADVAAHDYRFGQPCSVDINPDTFAQVISANHVIAIGFKVYPSFETTGPDGMVPPARPGEPLAGGHAVAVPAWELSPVSRTRYFVLRNSWDTSWGDKGYAYVKDDYFANIFDAWTSGAPVTA